MPLTQQSEWVKQLLWNEIDTPLILEESKDTKVTDPVNLYEEQGPKLPFS